MSDQDIFNKEEEATNIESDENTNLSGLENETNTTDQLLASIVNDNGEQKYKTTEEALKASAHAQDYIKQLETENAEYKEKGNPSEKLDELLAAVKQSKGSGEGEDPAAMKPEDVLTIVEKYISGNKATETKQTNIDTVVTVFKDRYGKDASKELYEKANDLGFAPEEINRMIASNPNAALKVLGVTPKDKPTIDTVLPNGQIGASQFQGTPDQAPTSIMGSTKSSDLTDAWKATQKRTFERLGIETKTN